MSTRKRCTYKVAWRGYVSKTARGRPSDVVWIRTPLHSPNVRTTYARWELMKSGPSMRVLLLGLPQWVRLWHPVILSPSTVYGSRINDRYLLVVRANVSTWHKDVTHARKVLT